MAGSATRTGRFAPLSHQGFRRLFGAQVVSTLGDNIAPVALAFAVLELHDSATDLGLVLAAYTFSLVVCLLLGGVWGDRVSRKRIMVLSDVSRAGAQGASAAVLLAGVTDLWPLVLLQALNGGATAFFRPALTGAIFEVVPSVQLGPANALLSMAANTMSFVGPATAGVLVAAVGAPWAVAADAVTFVGSAVFLIGLRLPARARPPSQGSILADLREGWDEVWSRDWLWIMIAVSCLFQVLVLATWQVLGPIVARDRLGGAAAWAAITSCFGAGAVLGGFAGLSLRPRRPMVACVGAMALVVAPLIALALAQSVVPIAVASIVAGAATALAGIFWETTLQQRVPEHAMSRVSAYDWLGSTALRPAGYAAMGAISGVVGVRATLCASAALTVALLAATSALPAIRRLQ